MTIDSQTQSDDTRKPVETQAPEQNIEMNRRRLAAAQAIQKHFNLQPDGVVIASYTDGKVTVDVTSFGSMGDLLFAERLIQKYTQEVIDKVLVGQRQASETQA